MGHHVWDVFLSGIENIEKAKRTDKEQMSNVTTAESSEEYVGVVLLLQLFGDFEITLK